MYTVKVEQFEGPLDLLLQLIEQEQLSITTVSLATVTEQYLNRLEQLGERLTPADLSDFLVVAAKLLLIKSQALLPYLTWDQEDEDDSLEHQLKIYREYAVAAKGIHQIILKRQFSFSRERLLVQEEVGFAPPTSLTALRLSEVFAGIIGSLPVLPTLPQGTVRRTINIQEKIAHLRQLLEGSPRLHFSHVLRSAKDRTEVIVSFLALLELIKMQNAVVRQDDLFSDIFVERVAVEASNATT